MRRMLAGMASLTIGLAVCSGAWAQQDGNNRGKGDPPSGGKQTIRGVVAGITLIGETVINFETKQAEAARASYLTILGSPSNGDQNHNNGNNNNANVRRGERDNVYIVAITPNTQVRMASESGQANKNNQEAFENLEVGDQVEVAFTPSDLDRNRRQASDHRHGRDRTFHGDAVSIKILSMPGQDQSNDRDRDKDKDRDRDRDRSSSSSSSDKQRQ
jgi:hypothetical protein